MLACTTHDLIFPNLDKELECSPAAVKPIMDSLCWK